ncbi:hypothetical protein DJICPGNB_17810 [Escherichia coli]|nr:hypothetical protein DJICPGNB_17810 [Escherichia coli]
MAAFSKRAQERSSWRAATTNHWHEMHEKTLYQRKVKSRGLLQFSSVKESVSAYVTNLNTHPAYSSFRKSRAQLRKADQEVTATAMIHKLKGYSTKGKSYNNYLFAMYQDNQRLISAHM